MRCAALRQLPRLMELVDHPEPMGFLRRDRVARHEHLQRPARPQQARQQRGRAAARGQADHRLGLSERGGVGGDDEVGALGDLAAAPVGDAVDRREDRLAQLPQRVEGAVEVLTLAQPLLLGHALALAQIAADRERTVAGAGEDRDADRRLDRDGLEDLGQARAHLGGDRVVGVWPVERDQGDLLAPGVLEEHRRGRLVALGRRGTEVQGLPTIGRCGGGGHRASPSVRSRAPRASAVRAGRGQSSTRRRGSRRTAVAPAAGV